MKFLTISLYHPRVMKGGAQYVAKDLHDAATADPGVEAVMLAAIDGNRFPQYSKTGASITALPDIRRATSLPILFDSGIEGGLDILRAIALGADFVMLGRAFHYALGALGRAGPEHLVGILTRDLAANLGQLGVARPTDLRGLALRRDHGLPRLGKQSRPTRWPRAFASQRGKTTPTAP